MLSFCFVIRECKNKQNIFTRFWTKNKNIFKKEKGKKQQKTEFIFFRFTSFVDLINSQSELYTLLTNQ